MSGSERSATVVAAQSQLEASRLQLRRHLHQKPVSALDTVSATARAALMPIAQRHPLGLVLGALLLGGLIAWSRPWRWLFQPSLLAGLWPGLLTRVLADLPIKNLMALWASVMTPPPSDPAPTEPTAPTGASQPQP